MSRTEHVRFAIEIDSHDFETKVYEQRRVCTIHDQNHILSLRYKDLRE